MAQAADRQFYSVPTHLHNESDDLTGKTATQPIDNSVGIDSHVNVSATDRALKKEALLRYIANNVIGAEKTFTGPYGLRNVTYVDYVASGRSLQFIEDYIRDEVLPEYGNTHTTTSVTSLQTTLFRHEARDIIRNSCNASEHDSVIFVGSGTTGAVHKLIHSLHLEHSPIVFVGPYEHHSNILPWKQVGSQVVRVKEDKGGGIDLLDLNSKLEANKDKGRQLIGVFSAASNVTGILSDTVAVTICLHRHGALAFWDYASAAPYVKIDMNPYIGGQDQHLVYKDAIYFSVHKFVGGTSTPGVLIAKKTLFRHPVPHGCGGGTVFFVRREQERYLQEAEVKEEGGTPAIVDSVRAGLVFQLKEAVGWELIHERDQWLLSKAKQAWADCENLVVLGPDSASQKLPVFSFLVYHPATGRFLHHNFLASVLNDVFGIQARGGCACAGPYAMDLLGLPEHMAQQIEELIAEDSRLDRVHLRRKGEYSHREILRPGFVRINLPYFYDEVCVDFVLEAIAMVARHAWTLLPQYLFNPETGEWRQKDFQSFKDRKWLGHISYDSGEMQYHTPRQHVKGPLPSSYQDCLDKARDIFTQASKVKYKMADQTVMFDEAAQGVRWFVLPSEANSCLHGGTLRKLLPPDLPFCPAALLARKGYILESQQRSVTSDTETEGCFSGMSNSGTRYCENPTEKCMKSFSTGFVQALNEGFEHSASGSLHRDSLSELELSDVPSDLYGTLKTDNVEGGPVYGKDSLTQQDSSVENDAPVIADCDSNVLEEKINSNFNSSVCPVSLSDISESLHETKIEDKENVCFNPKKEVAGPSANSSSCPFVIKKIQKDGFGTDGTLSSQENVATRWFSPPKHIFKPTVNALEEYSMIQNGDKVLVCLSGGKDSLSLLHTIHQYWYYAKGKGINFTLGAVTVDPQTPAYDPSPLKQYLASLIVPYFYESQGILETAENLPYECASICSFCSRMKRGRIYAAARREGYNVLALGQHLDDLSESFLMSFFHNGNLNTMKAHYTVKQGDLRVIRPFVYVREADLRHFAEKNKLPIIAENCPACFEAPKERHRTKQLLAAQEIMFPHVYNSMMAAMKPLMGRGRRPSPHNGLAQEETVDDDDDS